jgi:uncharacterized membrane protein YjjB (DUF3815 family)
MNQYRWLWDNLNLLISIFGSIIGALLFYMWFFTTRRRIPTKGFITMLRSWIYYPMGHGNVGNEDGSKSKDNSV